MQPPDFNYPFTFISKRINTLLARTYRTNLWQKFQDTFWFFFGEPPQSWGLFDYLTLGIPITISLTLSWLFLEKLPRNLAIDILIHIIPSILINFLPRFLFSALGVLIAAPFVLFIHLCSKLLSDKIKIEAFQIMMQTCEGSRTDSVDSLYRLHRNRLTTSYEETPIQTKPEIRSLDDELRVDGYSTLETYSTEQPTVRQLNEQFIWSILLFKENMPCAIIPIASPNAAYRITQLGRINFAHIHEQLESDTEFKTHVDNMQQGLIPWNQEASQNGRICLFLLQIKNKALFFDIALHIATYLIPDSIKVANKETGYLYPKTKAPFFLIKRAEEIMRNMVDTKTQETCAPSSSQP